VGAGKGMRRLGRRGVDPGSPTFWITGIEHVRDGDQVVVRVDLL
jgi:hypothetical protein